MKLFFQSILKLNDEKQGASIAINEVQLKVMVVISLDQGEIKSNSIIANSGFHAFIDDKVVKS